MLEIGTLGYVIDERNGRMTIKAVRVSSNLTKDSFGNEGYIADFLVIREHRLVKGIPIEDFESTAWQKIPKMYRELDPQMLHNVLDCVVYRLTETENTLTDV